MDFHDVLHAGYSIAGVYLAHLSMSPWVKRQLRKLWVARDELALAVGRIEGHFGLPRSLFSRAPETLDPNLGEVTKP